MASVAGVARSVLTATLATIVALELRDPFDLPLTWMGVVVLARAAVAAFEAPARAHAAATVRRTAQRVLYRHMLEVGPLIRDTTRTGDLTAAATDAVDRMGAMIGRFVPLVVRGLAVPLLMSIWAMVIDLWVGLAMLVTFPAVPGALRFLERGFRDAGTRLRRSRDTLAADFLDAIQGLPTLKLFDRGRERADILADRSEQVRRDTMDVLRVNQRALIWVDLVYSAVSVLVVVAVVAWRISAGAVGVPEGTALFLLAMVAIAPLVDVVSFFYIGALGLAATRRIREILDFPTRRPGAANPDVARRGSIRLDDVVFTYDGATSPALDGITLTIEAGASVALVGRSGAGKSTLAALVLGLRRPDRGRVLVDGVDIADVDPGWLASRVTYVGQSTHLFTASVADNLRVARPEATERDLVEACSRANVLEVVERLPDGFDTVLGERGLDLSGGEAQRLGLARAFLADTPALVLDEATSGLDLETEALISEAVETLMRGRTVIVIAHRITTARRCDLVVHMEAGSIAAVAPPAQMGEGFFSRMARTAR